MIDSWLLGLADPWLLVGSVDAMVHTLPPSWAVQDAVRLLALGHAGAACATAQAVHEAARLRGDGATAVVALGLWWLSRTRHMNSFPGDMGASSADIEHGWERERELAWVLAAVEQARALPGAREARGAWSWLQFLANLPPGRAVVRDARHGHPLLGMLVQTQIALCEGVLDDASALSPLAVPFVQRSIAELLALAGDHHSARERLALAREGFAGQSHGLGIASCLTMDADWELAPLSSASLRNLVVTESSFSTSEHPWTIEAVEGDVGGRDVPRARALLGEALSIGRACGSRRAQASVLLRQAYSARLDGDHGRQVEDVTAACALTGEDEGSDLGCLAWTLLALARVDARQTADEAKIRAIGRWGRAEGSFSHALGLGLLLTRAGRQALVREGDYERADACYHLALTLDRELGAVLRVSQTHADLASLHRALGNRPRARVHQEHALDELSKAPARAVADQRATLLLQQIYQEALDHRDAEGMSRALERLPTFTTGQGDPASALAAAFAAQARTQANVLIPLYEACELRRLDRGREADDRFAEARRRAQQTPGPSGSQLEAIVLATRRQGSDLHDAARAFDAYLAAGGTNAGFVGQLLALMEQLGPGIASREQLQQVQRNLEQEFAFMVRVRQYERAARVLGQIERIGGPRWWDAIERRPWIELSDVGELYEGLGDYRRALDAFDTAIDQLERRRNRLSRDELKTALSADYGAQYLYFQAARTALRLAESSSGEAREQARARAFELSERGRARGLLDLLTTNLACSSHAMDDVELRRWRVLNAQAQLWTGLMAQARTTGDDARRTALEHKLEACERELAELVNGLVERAPSLASLLRVDAQIASLAELVGHLDGSTAVIQYMTLGEELLVWAVTAEGMTSCTVSPVPATLLGRRVQQVHEGCATGRPVASFAQELEWLSTTLLAPVHQVIEDHERLVLIPYGELHRLPFSALRWKEDWLGAQRTLSMLPSASVMLMLRRELPVRTRSALCVGDPVNMSHTPPFGARSALPALEHARAEARFVAKLYGSTPLVGADATLDAVLQRLTDASPLVFATHAVLYDEAPLLSGIALAEGELLTVSTLLGQHIDADLVVLSACRTGLGEHTRGEEIVGLTRGLLAAGARSAVVSLWSVSDGSTAVAMAHFHERLRAGDDAPTALRAAQSAIRKLSAQMLAQAVDSMRDLPSQTARPRCGGEHPMHWAPFIFVGTTK